MIIEAQPPGKNLIPFIAGERSVHDNYREQTLYSHDRLGHLRDDSANSVAQIARTPPEMQLKTVNNNLSRMGNQIIV